MTMPLRRRLKNFFQQYSDVTLKVREATSNDPWGPTGSLMMEIAKMSYHADLLVDIMQVLRERLNDSGKNWRHVYKSLVLLDYLIKNGSRQVIIFCHEKAHVISMLKDFTYIDKAGKDQGFYVRQKSRNIIDLLKDGRSLKLEREKAQRIQRQMFFPRIHSIYKLRPTAIGTVIEKQHEQHIKVTSMDPSSCTPEKFSTIQPVQDLMICEDKAQLLHISSEDQQAAPVPLDVVVSPPDPLKADFKRSEYQPDLLKSTNDPREKQLTSSYTLNPSLRPVSGNSTSHSTKEKRDWKEYGLAKSQPLRAELPDVKGPVTSPIQENIPWTHAASLSVPAKDEQKDLPASAMGSVPGLPGSSSSQLTISTGFAFKTENTKKSFTVCPNCASPKLREIISYECLNQCTQPVMYTGPLSTIPHRPYHSTNPFFSPGIPTRGQAELAAQSLETLSNVPRPSWLGLYPSTSLANVTSSSSQAFNPQFAGLETGMASIFVPPVGPRHPTNPFL
ncbi:ENTH domain-containing protein 1 [Dendropsophus ebraccatus]|uniref:ENTH domain-containing protein 1 n=1 Tax=Dendropsophus ebraccatus TaxID=150705 RepID=UPI003831E08F